MLPFENASPGGNYFYGGVDDGRGASNTFGEGGTLPMKGRVSQEIPSFNSPLIHS